MKFSGAATACIGAALWFPAVACAADEGASRQQWWQIAGGILALPAGMLGLVSSWVLIRKTRLEAKKAELEIREKEGKLGVVANRAGLSIDLVSPVVENQRILLILLRFVLLSVALLLWQLFGQIVSLIVGGVFVAAGAAGVPDLTTFWLMLLALALYLLPEIGKGLVIIGLGFPIARESASLLGMDLKHILLPWRRTQTSRVDASATIEASALPCDVDSSTRCGVEAAARPPEDGQNQPTAELPPPS